MSVPQVQITARDYYVLRPDYPSDPTKRLPLDAAIALVSVLYYESRLSPASQGYQTTETPGVLNPHGAYGIASWNGPRQQDLLTFATSHNLAVAALDTQLAFVVTEIANSYPNCWAAIRSTAAYTAIIPILVDEYENPKNKTAEINGALAIARPLAALPPPAQAAPTVPVPQAPLPQAPATVPPVPVPLPGLPPISATTAGRRAAQHDYALRMRDVLVQEKAAYIKDIDEEIAGWERMASVATTPALPPPTPQAIQSVDQPESTTTMPAIISMLFGNWKTTLSGVIAAAAQGVAAKYPEYAPLSQWVSAAGIAALGVTATDATKTK